MSDPNEEDRTEPQRKALEEMSRQLLERLNTMVMEQESRAHDFAQRSHSLSPLPGEQQPMNFDVPEVTIRMSPPELQADPLPSEPDEQPRPAEAPRQVASAVPPLVRKKETAREAAREAAPQRRPAYRPTPRPVASENKEESGMGWLIGVGALLFFLLRACS